MITVDSDEMLLAEDVILLLERYLKEASDGRKSFNKRRKNLIIERIVKKKKVSDALETDALIAFLINAVHKKLLIEDEKNTSTNEYIELNYEEKKSLITLIENLRLFRRRLELQQQKINKERQR